MTFLTNRSNQNGNNMASFSFGWINFVGISFQNLTTKEYWNRNFEFFSICFRKDSKKNICICLNTKAVEEH